MEQQLNATAGNAFNAFLYWISNPITQVLFWPLLGCLIISVTPAARKAAIRWTALVTSLMSLACSVLMVTGAPAELVNTGVHLSALNAFLPFELKDWFPFGQYLRFIPDPSTGGMQFVQDFRWMAIKFGETQSFGVNYTVGVDELSLPLVLLCTCVLVLVVLWAWKREVRLKEFFALTLFMQVGIIGSFVALDYVLLYLFWEWMLIPMFFLIAGWGKDREKATRAAIKFFIYTLLGSVFMLIAFIQLQVYAQGDGIYTFSIPGLALFSLTDGVNSMPITMRLMIFIGLLLGFAVKAPMWPFHTWLPDAHSEAPTEMSVILAALMLKCGTYAFLRSLYSTFPDICYNAGPVIALCGTVAIVYGAGITLVQTDLKRMVAYSSISHMGFIILGISAMNPASTTGAIFHMVGHGVLIALLFFLVGWIEEKYGTRDMRQLAGLWHTAPQAGGLLTLAAFAGMGFPGLIAFWGELLILQGTYFNNPQWLSVIIPSPAALWHLWAQVAGSPAGYYNNSLWYGPEVAPGLSGARFLQICAGLAVIGVLTSAVYMINMLMKVVYSGKTGEPEPAPVAAGGLQPALAGAGMPSAVRSPEPGASSGEVLHASSTTAGQGLATPLADLAPPATLDLGHRMPDRPRPAISGQLFGFDWNQALVLLPLAAAVIFLGLNPQPLLRLIGDVGNLMAATQWQF